MSVPHHASLRRQRVKAKHMVEPHRRLKKVPLFYVVNDDGDSNGPASSDGGDGFGSSNFVRVVNKYKAASGQIAGRDGVFHRTLRQSQFKPGIVANAFDHGRIPG